MAPSFGTSGLRGLVTDLTDDLISDYTHAFLSAVGGGVLYLGRDLRRSSPHISAIISETAQAAGMDVVDCGALATPALALTAMQAEAPAIMVTGSHIPADRNGLKFYLPGGEISKADEAAIAAACSDKVRYSTGAAGSYRHDPKAESRYVERYVTAFGDEALSGLRIGVYRHSSVARDTMERIFARLGAEVVPLGHSDSFIPVDTEAVDPETRDRLAGWCRTYGLDAVASTDGDADRPMLTDASGKVIPGDILGVLTARMLCASVVVTPVSSNDMVRRLPEFAQVVLTRIGSPFVIAGMKEAGAENVVGFEANGGFLLGFEAYLAGPLAPLPTRDCMLPILAPLYAARQAGMGLGQLAAELPPRFTASDRVQQVDREKADRFLNTLINDTAARQALFSFLGNIAGTDQTDGLRMAFDGGNVVHLRLSGNAPEFRIYAQADSEADAWAVLENATAAVTEMLR